MTVSEIFRPADTYINRSQCCVKRLDVKYCHHSNTVTLYIYIIYIYTKGGGGGGGGGGILPPKMTSFVQDLAQTLI